LLVTPAEFLKSTNEHALAYLETLTVSTNSGRDVPTK
jgi:hypothetical protein